MNKSLSYSVIIPTFNEAEMIKSCISSIGLDQSVVEIIVVDGGSSDDTTVIAEAAGATISAKPIPKTTGIIYFSKIPSNAPQPQHVQRYVYYGGDYYFESVTDGKDWTQTEIKNVNNPDMHGFEKIEFIPLWEAH